MKIINEKDWDAIEDAIEYPLSMIEANSPECLLRLQKANKIINESPNIPRFLFPDTSILQQIPEVIGPELEALIATELPDTISLNKDYQDILKLKLYLILLRRKVALNL